MPTFTLDRATHPFLDEAVIGRCFSIDVLLPGEEGGAVAVTAWVADFEKCLVAKPLAERLGFDISGGECVGELVVQTYFEGDLVIHRSKRFPLRFGRANRMLQDAYIHVDRSQLEELFWVMDYDAIRPNGDNLFFLVLRPRDEANDFCVEIPLEF